MGERREGKVEWGKEGGVHIGLKRQQGVLTVGAGKGVLEKRWRGQDSGGVWEEGRGGEDIWGKDSEGGLARCVCVCVRQGAQSRNTVEPNEHSVGAGEWFSCLSSHLLSLSLSFSLFLSPAVSLLSLTLSLPALSLSR